MSARKVNCPKCQKAFGLLDRQLGTDVYCPHCGQKIKIQAPPEQPAAATAEAFQQAAAAQLAGAGRPMSAALHTPAFVTHPDQQTDAAAEALAAALDGPAPAARSSGAAPRPAGPPMAQPIRHPGAGHATPGYAADSYLLQHRSSGSGQNKVLIWVALVVIVLGVAGLLGGIVWYQVNRARWAAEAEAEYDRQLAAVQAENARRQAKANQDRIARGELVPVTSGLTPIDTVKGNVRIADQEIVVPNALVFHVASKDLQTRKAGAIYRETPTQREVLIGYCENVTDKVVRKAGMHMQALGGGTKKVFGDEEFVFYDVKPGEKAWFAFDYAWVTEKEGTIWTDPRIQEMEPEQPEFEFEVTNGPTRSDGKYSGVISCSVTNKSLRVARKVALLAILYDGMNDISGYARGEIYDLGPTKTQEAKIRWENFDSEGVKRAEVSAQIAPRP